VRNFNIDITLSTTAWRSRSYPINELVDLVHVALISVDVGQTITSDSIAGIQFIGPEEQLSRLRDVLVNGAVVLAQIRERLLHNDNINHIHSS